ncbi:MAG: helix-turn-helix domain-containing protein [Deltaproteobacteria bacterium]|nr:helix-turn-helix domain-containing protein [Deltaproteobacteria bacterium]
MQRDVNRPATPATHIGTAEMSLAMWLRNGRAQKSLSVDDVARITKIQPRILERLEAGKLDGLPAEVFVRGFVRSFARCVGLDEVEAIRRYGACATPVAGKPAPATARAMIEAMGDLAPNARDKAPKVLRDEPANLAAGSMEIATSPMRPSEPSIVISFDDAPEADVPVEITFVETCGSEVISIETIAQLAAGDGDAGKAVAAAETVVVAPPPDIDLSADSSMELAVDAPASKPRAKRTRRATLGEAAPKRRRSKVANGTPAEPTPVIVQALAAEIADKLAGDSVEGAAPVDAADATVAPKRRRKARGSIQPPINTLADSLVTEQAEQVVEIPADVSIPADVAATPATAVDEFSFYGPSADVEAFAAAGASFAAARELELSEIDAPAVEVAFDSSLSDATDDSTTRFERSDDMQLSDDVVEQIEATWTPRMPAFPIAPTTSWRRSAAAPNLVAVIDDADPEGAERTLEDRRHRESRRTFLPPILMDRDGDRSARQGGLTLAVIILLIAATLTLSYLMRRPSAGGDGVTQLDDTTDVRSIG